MQKNRAYPWPTLAQEYPIYSQNQKPNSPKKKMSWWWAGAIGAAKAKSYSKFMYIQHVDI